MKVSIVGVGYVGLVAGAGFSELGNAVLCIDNDQKKITNLKNNVLSIYEPGLTDMVERNQKSGRLQFSTDLSEAIRSADVIFIAVGTPQRADGSTNLDYVYQTATEIGRLIEGYKVVVIKSTVPVGTGASVEKVIEEGLRRRGLSVSFDVVSNPEFLKEGVAVDDFMQPDRIIIGTESSKAHEIMAKLYEPFLRQSDRIIYMGRRSSELTKYAANAMLATRVSFMNELSRLCEASGADIRAVRDGIGSDPRIGLDFLSPGLGYGGSCLPKDVRALIDTGLKHDVHLGVLSAVHQANMNQRDWFFRKIENRFANNIRGLKFAVWGLAFKPGTDDIRESPAIDLVNRLVQAGAEVSAFDPVALQNAQVELSGLQGVRLAENSYDVLSSVDALVLTTEWPEFRSPDFSLMKKLMKSAIIFDGRNQYNAEDLKQAGFEYYPVGSSCT